MLDGSAIGAERMVVRPSRSDELGDRPARQPVTNASRPGRRRPELLRPGARRRLGVAPGEPPGRRSGVGPIGVHRPAAGDLEVVVERAAAVHPRRRPEDGVDAAGPLHQVQDRLLVPLGLRADHRGLGVVLDRHLERVGEDPVGAVGVVLGRPPGDVQVARLFGLVAVRDGHVPADPEQRVVVGPGHVGRDVGQRVAVRPHHEAAGLVERDRGLDLLPPVDDAAGQEVADRPRLRGRERLWTVVGDRLRVGARPAAEAPLVAVVAVEVGPDRLRSRRRLAVLPPVVELAAGDVVLGAVRVGQEEDVDLARVDDVRDPRVDAVPVDKPVEDLQAHLDAHVLVGMVGAVEEDLGLGLVGRHVVGDLGHPQLATLVALADREHRDDVRVGRGDRVDLVGQLGVAVEPLPALRELGRGHAAGGPDDEDEGRRQAGDDGQRGARSVGHAGKSAPDRVRWPPARSGHAGRYRRRTSPSCRRRQRRS